MRIFPGLRLRVRALARRRAVEAELEDELRFHLEMEAAKNERAGLSAEAARRAALVSFGGVDRYKEAVRDGRGVRWLDELAADVRYALRGIRLRPGLAAAVVLLLALGIGANAAMFGIVDRLLLRPPAAVRDPGRVGIFYFRQTMPLFGLVTQASSSYSMYSLLRERSRTLTSVGAVAFGTPPVSLGRGEGAEPVSRGAASSSFFQVLGVEPRLGRLFTADEDRVPVGQPVVVLSDGFWRRHFGGAAGILGRRVQLGAGLYTIVGVLPPGFTGLDLEPIDVWTPLGVAGSDLLGQGWDLGWGDLWLTVVGRLRPGATVAEVEAEANGLFRRGLAQQEAEERGGAGAAASTATGTDAAERVDPTARAIFGSIVGGRAPSSGPQSDTARVALWLSAVALLVLLVACANVANLLLARALARRKETAVRLALGVSRGRLLRALLVETLVLAGLGGGGAVLLAAWGGGLLRRMLLPGVDWQGAPVNARVLMLVGALVVASAMLAGLAPAGQSWRSGLADALKTGARAGRRSRTRAALVVAQTGLTVVLLVGAGLFVRSLRKVLAVPRGFDPERVLLVEPGLARHGVPSVEAARMMALAAERLRHLPGVRGVALATSAPFRNSHGTTLRVPGLDSIPIGKDGGPYIVGISPGYFRTMRMRIIVGRDLLESDREGAPHVAVVSATMARLLWPGRSALGQCLLIGHDPGCAEVVGVAGDALRQSLESRPVLQYYVPIAQHAELQDQARILVGTTGPAEGAVAAVRRTVLGVSPEMPYPSVRPLAALIAPHIQPWRLGASLFTLFGLLALLVAAVGLYGVVAYDVAQHTPEMAIRLAIGAPAARVIRLVIARSLWIVGIGTVIGSLLAALVAPALGPLLFHESPRDPAVFLLVIAVLLAAALAAALVPARRASRLDPAAALRAE